MNTRPCNICPVILLASVSGRGAWRYVSKSPNGRYSMVIKIELSLSYQPKDRTKQSWYYITLVSMLWTGYYGLSLPYPLMGEFENCFKLSGEVRWRHRRRGCAFAKLLHGTDLALARARCTLLQPNDAEGANAQLFYSLPSLFH